MGCCGRNIKVTGWDGWLCEQQCLICKHKDLETSVPTEQARDGCGCL